MRIVRATAFVLLGLLSLELCARAAARRSLYMDGGGLDTDLGTLALMALATGIIGQVAAWRVPRVRLAMLFATLCWPRGGTGARRRRGSRTAGPR